MMIEIGSNLARAIEAVSVCSLLGFLWAFTLKITEKAGR